MLQRRVERLVTYGSFGLNRVAIFSPRKRRTGSLREITSADFSQRTCPPFAWITSADVNFSAQKQVKKDQIKKKRKGHHVRRPVVCTETSQNSS